MTKKRCDGCLIFKEDVENMAYKSRRIGQICESCQTICNRLWSIITSNLQSVGEMATETRIERVPARKVIGYRTVEIKGSKFKLAVMVDDKGHHTARVVLVNRRSQ